jgi:DHA2 family multidrug resistance protein
MQTNSWDITTKQRITYTIIVMVGAFMAILDTTVVDVIVPKLTGPLSSDMYGVQWIITSYMISAAVALLICEYLIKKYGPKIIFLIGVGVFSSASFFCGVSNSLDAIIVARVFQGFSEALIMVTSHIMVFSYFPPNKKGLAMGIFALGVSFAPALGPTVGGYLTQFFNWRMVFFINVPIGLILVIAGAIFLPKDKNLKALPFNYFSFLLISLATIFLLIMLSKGQQLGWFNSSLIGILLFSSIILYLGYILVELNSKHKLIDFSLFKNPNFTNGILIYFFILGFSMYQYFYLLPIYYEHIKMLPTFEAGIAVFAFALFIGLFSPVAGILSDKIGAKYTLLIASTIYLVVAFFLLPTLNYYTPLSQAIILTIPFGIAMGMFFAPVTVLLMQSVPKEKGELAIVLMDYFRFVGGSFGTALATNNMEFYKNFNFDRLTQIQNTTYVDDFLNNGTILLNTSRDLMNAIFRNYELFISYNYGFSSTFFWAGSWAVVGSIFVISLFIFKGKSYV